MISSEPRKVEPAWEPQIVGALSGVRITDIIAGPSATHSFFISDDGKLFGLGELIQYHTALRPQGVRTKWVKKCIFQSWTDNSIRLNIWKLSQERVHFFSLQFFVFFVF